MLLRKVNAPNPLSNQYITNMAATTLIIFLKVGDIGIKAFINQRITPTITNTKRTDNRLMGNNF